MKRLEGKSALITGAARGIGRGFAEAYVREGATVALADINLDAAQAAAAEIGEGAYAVHLDVTDQASIDAAVTAVVEKVGKLDILINNAALFDAAEIVDITRDPGVGASMHYGAQELCPQLDFVIRFDPAREGATQIVACVGDEGQVPVDLPADLVEQLGADISSEAGQDGWKPSGGTRGMASDIEIQAREIIKMNQRLIKIYAKATGQSEEKIAKDIDRDYWLSAEDAVTYGLVGRIIESHADIG